jgi:hypothetical protein
MSDRLRKLMLAGMAGAMVMGGAAQAHAAPPEPVRIGVLDLQARSVADDDANVKVVYREFTLPGRKAGSHLTASGRDHGVIVATSAVRAVRQLDRGAKIEIYAGNAFQQTEDGKGYSMRYDKAVEALQWMSDKGVRVVVTAFNTRNEASSRFLMDKADSLGMTVVAGASNVGGAGKVFPAADGRSISVADTTPSGSSLTLDATVQTWVKFGLRGDYADASLGGKVVDWGSSYSSAKAGGYAAYYVSRNPQATRVEIEGVLRNASDVRTQRHGKVEATIATLGEGSFAERIRGLSRSGPAGSMAASTSLMAAKGPESSVQATLMAAMAARSGASR